MEACDQSNLYFWKDFELLIPCLTTYILEVTALTLLKVANIHHRGKKLSKSYYSEAQTEECNQINLFFSNF